MIVAPPSAHGSTWTRRFGDYSDAFASGWMQLRGARRRRSIDRGFVLSDHADWPGLQRAIRATGAERVIVTHGYEAVMVRWLGEQGLDASAFATEYGDQDDEDPHPDPLPQAGEGEAGVPPLAQAGEGAGLPPLPLAGEGWGEGSS
jgi:putative mRNA 3-end processing factor